MPEMAFAIGKGNTSVPGAGCGFIPNPKLKLLDQVSEVMRFKHYSIRTETTYRDWIKRFIFFHGKRHPREMGAFEVERFLSDLAVTRRVAASTQNQAFNALLFLYREVLHQEWGELGKGGTGQTPAAAAGGYDPKRSGSRAGRYERHSPVDGEIAVWDRHEIDGMCAGED